MSAFPRRLASAAILLLLVGGGLLCWRSDTASAQGASGKRVALLVGVNEYEHAKLTPLKYAVNDVTELGKVLKEAGYEVTLLTDAAGKQDAKLAPTKANIEKHLHDLARGCKKDDTFVLAFTGHGLQFGGQKDAYYCPVDARPLESATDTLVSISKVYDELDGSYAGAKIVLVDACRNDPTPGRGRGLDADTAPAPPKGIGVLFSCSAGQRAFEHDSLKHGVFFHYILEGLRKEAADKKNRVTFDSLQSYVRDEVTDKVHALFPDQKPDQFPNVKGDFAGRPLVLLTLDSFGTTPKAEMSLVGKKLEIAGKSLDGADFNLQMFKGKVVLVNFWATWAPPCRSEVPVIKAAHKKYHKLGFEVIGISLDRDREDLETFVKEQDIRWINLFDDAVDPHPMVTKHGIRGVPTALLVDKDGKVVSVSARGEELDKLLEKHLGTP